jgi:hypothetical protein
MDIHGKSRYSRGGPCVHQVDRKVTSLGNADQFSQFRNGIGRGFPTLSRRRPVKPEVS